MAELEKAARMRSGRARRRRRERLVLTPLLAVATVFLTVLIAPAAGATTVARNTVCDGVLPSGTYYGLTVKGHCSVAEGSTVTIRGRLVVTEGSNFDAETYAATTIIGSVYVAPGANFGLGQDEQGPSQAVLKGALFANHPFALQILGATVTGSILVVGGQTATCTPDPTTARGGAPSNMPIKDNTINGSVTVLGWSGCWFGFIRNQVHGHVLIAGVTGNGYQEELGFNDSSEIVTNQIWGTLACYANTPAPWIGDSEGAPNVVHGMVFGECRPVSTRS